MGTNKIPSFPPQVVNQQHLRPSFKESVMELLALALALLPNGGRDYYHQIINKVLQNVVTLFVAQHVVESIKETNVEDLVKKDDTLEFSYLREVSRWPEVLGESEVVHWC